MDGRLLVTSTFLKWFAFSVSGWCRWFCVLSNFLVFQCAPAFGLPILFTLLRSSVAAICRTCMSRAPSVYFLLSVALHPTLDGVGGGRFFKVQFCVQV